MKLNLGSGERCMEGYVNVDLRTDVADVVASVECLPFADDSAEEVVALDLLEHFQVWKTQDLLDEWKRVLKPGGTLTVKVPNLLELARYIVDGRSVDLVVRNIYGGHRWGPDGAWDTHHTGFTPSTIRATLETAGFQVRRIDESLNMTVEAVHASPSI